MRIALVGCMLGLMLASKSVVAVYELPDDTDMVLSGPAPADCYQKRARAIPVSQSVLFNRECEKWPFTPLPERAMPPPLWCDNAEQAGLTGTCTHPNSSAADRSTLAEGHKAARRWAV
jgi:hypothetical protein